ncbi:MAG: hypothetical protein ACOC5E_03185, partial [Acidobacteriota bacterium]
MTAPPMELRFAAHGLTLALRTDSEALDQVGPEVSSWRLPPGWKPDPEPHDQVAATYRLDVDRSSDRPWSFDLYVDAERVATGADASAAVRAFLDHAERLVAERSPAFLFVHAGVVAWKGHAVLMPGPSLAGKTTLVRAFLEAGATYYSDEYAVLDRSGRVHPYPRPLRIRGRHGAPMRRVSAEALDAPIGRDPLLPTLVLATSYRPGVHWRPARLSRARALLALMDNAVAARGDPGHSMPILRNVVSRARTLAGPRGEAPALVADVASRLGEGRA